MKKRKYVIVIPDGFADLPIESLGGKTPMQYAKTPNLDQLAKTACLGRSHNVPKEYTPGSDVATLSLLGYNPADVYTGRAPLEAVAQGIDLGPDDWAFRCNLVTLENNIMKSFTADHISTDEASKLLTAVQNELAGQWNTFAEKAGEPQCRGSVQFYPGVSYRNLMIFRPEQSGGMPFSRETMTYPPHDYTDQSILNVLPSGPGAKTIRFMMNAIEELFKDDPINKSRQALGKLPASNAWLWGQGRKPALVPFADRFSGVRGAMITAVDLLRGIAGCLQWDIISVPNITGYVDTDFAAKGEYAALALDQYDLVCVHIEATDEAGHEGSVEKKVKALEDIDAKTLPPILKKLETLEDWRLWILPDHPTPIKLKTHSHGEIPWLVTSRELQKQSAKEQTFDEVSAQSSKIYFERGWEMMENFLFAEDFFK